jgi:hypothetical protein
MRRARRAPRDRRASAGNAKRGGCRVERRVVRLDFGRRREREREEGRGLEKSRRGEMEMEMEMSVCNVGI